jgi:2-dehydropantoate 2-reductase
MDVCIFGAGSLGSLVGGLLARAHDVTLVGREPHVSAVEREGLRIGGAIDEQVSPDARTGPPDQTELVVVTVKSFDTEAAARALEPVDCDAVLSLQNGMGNEETLAEHLDCPVLAGTCTYGARLADPGVVECTGIGEIHLGPRDGGRSAIATEVGEAFAAADLDAEAVADMPRRLWQKLAVNAGINATTALARVPNGALVEGEASGIALTAARETARVATDEGVTIEPDGAAERTRAVAETTAANTSSMYQDVVAGKRTEVEAINGYVVAHADRPVPANETLAGLLRAWEQERGLGTGGG